MVKKWVFASVLAVMAVVCPARAATPDCHRPIVIADVDGDQDLDLVVTSWPQSGHVRIWINDGTGRFDEGDATLYSAAVWFGTPILTTGDAPDNHAVNPKRSLVHHGVSFRPVRIRPNRVLDWGVLDSANVFSVLHTSVPGLRAPPLFRG